jgi:acetyltransferase-like isoleucine patch superfamily enzyme
MPQYNEPFSIDTIRNHPAWAGKFLGGTTGFTAPDLSQMKAVPLGASNRSFLEKNGLLVRGDASESIIFYPEESSFQGLSIALNNFKRGVLVLGSAPKLSGQISLEGDDHLCVFGTTHHSFRINATFRNKSSALFVGIGCSARDVDFLIEGPNNSIQVGDDAMISLGVSVLSSDSHGIISTTEPGGILNGPESVIIGQHVWLGDRAIVSKGRKIGSGSIVGARSIVTRDVPARAVVSGAPAEIRRVEVTWTRAMYPNEAEINRAIAAAANF